MPYIVIKTNGQEIDCRELTGDTTIGRAAECEVVVRDILLSRRHCRLQQEGGGWKLCDLQSKNGTVLNGERLTAGRMLRDNDVLRLGRWKIVFHAGTPEQDISERVMMPARPADPSDSLAGTLSGFTLLLPGETEIPQNMPSPQPRPRDPPAYGQEELQTLLSGIASSSWDSVYAEARQPLKNGSTVSADEEATVRRIRPRSPMDLSLQVNPAPPVEAAPAVSSAPRWKFEYRPNFHLIVAGAWIIALVLLNICHKPMPRQSMADENVILESGIATTSDSFTSLDSADQQEADATQPPTRVPMKQLHFNAPALTTAAKAGAVYFPLVW